MTEFPARIEHFEGQAPDQPLPEHVDGWCPWKESGPDGDRICTFLEGHGGDCDMQPVTT